MEDDVNWQAVLPPLPAVITDDAVMDYTQQKRMQIIEALTRDNKLPEDVKEQTTLMKALDGLDKQAMGKKRLIVEDKKADNEKEAAALVNAALRMMSSQRLAHVDVIDVESVEIPTLPDHIPPPVLAPGETDATSKPETFDSFMAQQDTVTN